ncbi:SDR family oxidoreductase [Rivibacter subsaxonicus]|uniref:NAD(P)-dependent dehydrogenase (Short-subunit alcohol dehydrogenase family) n=1 Tax=Rivibacter subsaxonicus TaxID=457575 RepID=A0A4Q7VZU9_9BURK|nr:NAD(P)-dependent dehydrogenase (short-subunit alcohol dehydrogenase family) [Rivibacter subsaxonicus]
MTTLFNGEVALVTGGSSGIGRATALAFAAEGARVVVASRRSEESTETVSLIRAAGGDAIFVKADVSKASEVEALVARAVEHYGALNFAFNNAGIEGDPFVPLARYSETSWDEVIDINLKGVFLSMKYELPHIVRTRGAIVNMASVAGLRGGRLGVAYYASKHGVVGLTKAAALEYADQGVRINAVAPAVIQTPLADRAGLTSDPARTARVLAMHPLGRVGVPEEVANAVLWLCSKGASFTTGHALPVDGGYLI